VVESDFFGVDVGRAPVVPECVVVEACCVLSLLELCVAAVVVLGVMVDALDVTIDDVLVAVTVVVTFGFVVVADPCVFVGVFAV
jgi:hypothetical protein